MIQKLLRKLYYALSAEGRLWVRKVVYFPLDVIDRVRRGRSSIKPDRGDIYVGSGDFVAQGKSQIQLLIRHAGLTPSSRVLDVGSGIGRTAVPLTTFLDGEGSYEGFDVVEKGVRWCIGNISRTHPNFSFRYVPLSNDLYNTSSEKATDFTFPYGDAEFDVVFLFSVFSHMQVAEIERYLQQIARTLKPGGRCLATCFIYDDQNERSAGTQAGFNFPHKGQGYRLMDKKVTGANVAVNYRTILNLIEKSGLELVRFIPGSWLHEREKTPENSFQDILILSL